MKISSKKYCEIYYLQQHKKTKLIAIVVVY